MNSHRHTSVKHYTKYHFSACPDVSWAPVPGKVAGEVKLSILYKSEKLFIMVMHIRGLVSVCIKCKFSFLNYATFTSLMCCVYL